MKTGIYIRFHLLVALLAGATGLSSERERPRWVDFFQAEDSENLYYIGRASEVKNEVEGFFQCFQDAKRQAVFEFGVQTQIRTETIRRLKETDLLNHRAEEESELIELKEFRLKDSYVEKGKGDFKNIWTLYQYPKVEKEKEKARIAKGGIKKALTSFSVYGAPSKYKGLLRIDTVPQGVGATIYLDGEKLPAIQTPLEMSLSPGVHTYKVDHPQFEAIEGQVILNPSERVERNHVLERAHGNLTLETVPPGLEVEVAGYGKGRAPLKITLPADEAIKVLVRSSKHEDLDETVRVQKNEDYTTTLRPQPKPARIESIKSVPEGAEVRINGSFKGNTPLPDIIVRGKFTLEVSALGYETYSKEVEAQGLDVLKLELVELSKAEEPKPQLLENSSVNQRPEVSFGIGYMLSGNFSNTDKTPLNGINLNTQVRLSSVFSLELNGALAISMKNRKNTEITDRYYFLRLGLPVFFLNETYFLEPFGVFASNGIETKYSGGNVIEGPKRSAFGYGLALGGAFVKKDENGIGLTVGIQKIPFAGSSSQSQLAGFLQLNFICGGKKE